MCILNQLFSLFSMLSFEEGVGSIAALSEELVEMKEVLSKCVSPIVFCHNDLLCGNFIYNEEKGA